MVKNIPKGILPKSLVPEFSILTTLFFILLLTALAVTVFCVFFDQAVLTRRGTLYRVDTQHKKIAITFDDGPSPTWTPRILEALREAGIKATFFMVGHHVRTYPEIARQVAHEGHAIGNHGFAHSVLLYYTPAEVEEEIKYTEMVIEEVTGQRTRYFRPPKAWLRPSVKTKIKDMGYEIVLWSLNSKDWVSFNHRYIVKYLVRRVRNGDIVLFHDSGNVLSREGGDRTQTVAAIPLLVEKLKNKGFEIVPLDELLHSRYQNSDPTKEIA